MPRAASIHDLPVSLLEAVFGRLKLQERCVAVALLPTCAVALAFSPLVLVSP
jgi:hypothetical protein